MSFRRLFVILVIHGGVLKIHLTHAESFCPSGVEFLFFWRQTDTCTSRHCEFLLFGVFSSFFGISFCHFGIISFLCHFGGGAEGGREGRGTKQSAICQAQAHMARAVVLQEAGFSRLACSFPQRNSRHPGERGFGPQPGGDLRQLERCNSVWGIV